MTKIEVKPRVYAATGQAAESSTERTMYTCPMDPEVVQEGPGTCTICGMALEPMGGPPVDAGPNLELVDFSRRLKIAAPLQLVLLLVEMSSHLFGINLVPFIPPKLMGWFQLAIAAPVVLWCG